MASWTACHRCLQEQSYYHHLLGGDRVVLYEHIEARRLAIGVLERLSRSVGCWRGEISVGGNRMRCAADSTRRPISETDPTILGQMTKCDQKGEPTRAICRQHKTSSVLMRAPQFRITAQCCIDKVAASFASVLVDSSINLSRSGEPPLSSRSLIAHSRRIIAAWSSS